MKHKMLTVIGYKGKKQNKPESVIFESWIILMEEKLSLLYVSHW